MKELREKTPDYVMKGKNYNIGQTLVDTPRIDLKDSRKKKPDKNLTISMVKDTEKFRVKRMLKALSKTSDATQQYEIIVYLLKSMDSLTPEQSAQVINHANKMFTGTTLLEKATVRLAKTLSMLTGEKRVKEDKKFEEMMKDREGDTVIEI